MSAAALSPFLLNAKRIVVKVGSSLVTDEGRRSEGVGRALVDWLSSRAQMLKAANLALDSGTHRVNAHRFYLRERFDITSFHFNKKLD